MGVEDMTLGEAVGWFRQESWGCACTGGEWCCMRRSAQVEALLRGAHIAVRQLADLRDRDGYRTEWST